MKFKEEFHLCNTITHLVLIICFHKMPSKKNTSDSDFELDNCSEI